MNKLINIRYPLLVALALMLGVMCAYNLYFGKLALSVVSLVLCIVLITFLAIRKSKGYLVVALFLTAVLVGMLRTEVTFVNYQNNEYYQTNVYVEGRVTDLGRNGDSQNTLYLDNCVTQDGVRLQGKVKVTLYNGSKYGTGDTLMVKGDIHSLYVVKSGVNTTYVRRNANYEMSNATLVAQKHGNLRLDEKIRKYVYDNTGKYMDSQSDVAYSLLTGDRNALDADKNYAFVQSGIIHLLAVSGLHVGFVVAVFAFLLKKFRLHSLVELAILLVPLIFYAYVCSFSPSIVRAIVMTVCVYVAKALFGKADLLSSLGWAIIVIMLVSPLYLFDVGFQLSVLSVYGIATLNGWLNRLLSKVKCNKLARRLLDSVCVSLSCSLSTLFCVAMYYNQVALLGVFTNLLAIPLVSCAFVLLIFAQVPLLGFVMVLADKILNVVNVVANFVSNVSFATASLPTTYVALFAVIVILFVISGYVNVKAKGKAITSCVLMLVALISIFVSVLPQKTQQQINVFVGYQDSAIVATDDNGNVAVVSNFADSYVAKDVFDYLDDYSIESCTLYCTSGKDIEQTVLSRYVAKYCCTKVYLLDTTLNPQAESWMNGNGVTFVHVYKNTIVGDAITVQNVYDGSLTGVVVDVGGITVANMFGEQVVQSNFVNHRHDIDVFVTNLPSDSFGGTVTISRYQTQYDGNYGANKYGHFTITQKDDNIILAFI